MGQHGSAEAACRGDLGVKQRIASLHSRSWNYDSHVESFLISAWDALTTACLVHGFRSLALLLRCFGLGQGGDGNQRRHSQVGRLGSEIRIVRPFLSSSYLN